MDSTTLAQEVLKLMAQDGLELGEDLNGCEQAIQRWLRKAGAAALETHLAGRKLGYEGSSRACSCGANQRFVEHRSKTVATLMGSVLIRRGYYHCRACGRSALPYDERIGLGTGAVSVGLAKAATLLAVHEPFESASRMLYELTGQRLSERTVERLTHRVGQTVSESEERLADQMRRWRAPAAEVRPHRLYVAVDGTMVPRTDAWRESKVVTCYWEDEYGKREARYRVRFDGAQDFKAHVWALACRCGLETAEEVILLGDGARWIWDQVRPVLGEKVTDIVDWYHATEHVWDCGKALYGEGTEQTTGWVKQIETWLWEGEVRRILQSLGEEQARVRAGPKREALRQLITYLTNQGERLAYDRFRARGLDIGSGRVEAACKHVVGMRMKRSGMHWSPQGAQTTLSLRTAWMNGEWDSVWVRQPLAAA